MRIEELGSFSNRFNLLKNGQKRSQGVPLYTLYLNRPVGRMIAAASPSWVTPNILTYIGSLLTYLAIFFLMFFAENGNTVWLIIGVSLTVGFFFDSADGQLARLRNQGSLSGEWLDHVLDGGRIVFLHVATLWFLVRNQVAEPTVIVAVCAIFAVAAAAVFFAGMLFDQLLPGNKSKNSEEGLDRGSRRRMLVRSTVMLPVDYGVLCLAYALVPWAGLFFIIYVILAAAKVTTTSMLLGKWFGALRRADAERAMAKSRIENKS